MRWLAALLLAAAAPDSGARAVSVPLGGPVSGITGEAWPARSTMHEVKGPVELTVVLPSGRRYVAATRSAIVNTKEDRATVRSIYVDLGTAPTWAAIVEASQAPLIALGVAAERREAWKKKLLEKPVPFPSYPVEGCVVVTTTLREKRGAGYYLSLELSQVDPALWHRPADWPDTCR